MIMEVAFENMATLGTRMETELGDSRARVLKALFGWCQEVGREPSRTKAVG